MELSRTAAPADAETSRTPSRRRGRLTRAALAGAAATLATAGLAGPALAKQHSAVTAPTYSFTTKDNAGDPTFNQLLGINNSGEIAGYFGSGMAGHPNQGYTLSPDLSTYTPENYPSSVQTQVTGLDDKGITVGFWSGTNTGTDSDYGFWSINGHYHTVVDPTGTYGTPAVNQLLGVNNHWTAVGFYTDASGTNHGYTYSILSDTYQDVTPTGFSNVTASGIDNRNDVVGFGTGPSGSTEGFLETSHGRVLTLDVKDSTSTTPLGVNDHREVVGTYVDSAGATHGFTWTPLGGFHAVDDPSGVQGTTVNGVNNAGDLVGFYTDAAGNTHGMIATPSAP